MIVARRGVLEPARGERREISCGIPARGLGRGATTSRSRPPSVTPIASGFGNCFHLLHRFPGSQTSPTGCVITPVRAWAAWPRFAARRLATRDWGISILGKFGFRPTANSENPDSPERFGGAESPHASVGVGTAAGAGPTRPRSPAEHGCTHVRRAKWAKSRPPPLFPGRVYLRARWAGPIVSTPPIHRGWADFCSRRRRATPTSGHPFPPAPESGGGCSRPLPSGRRRTNIGRTTWVAATGPARRAWAQRRGGCRGSRRRCSREQEGGPLVTDAALALGEPELAECRGYPVGLVAQQPAQDEFVRALTLGRGPSQQWRR